MRHGRCWLSRRAIPPPHPTALFFFLFLLFFGGGGGGGEGEEGDLLGIHLSARIPERLGWGGEVNNDNGDTNYKNNH